MGCYGPLTAYRGPEGMVFDKRLALYPRAIPIPCGQCVGCRLERSRVWALRCLHEKKLHRHNCFVTLTYDDDHLPEGGTLVKRDLQLFLKRLRAKHGAGIRFYACGEYGDIGSRPHYHAILFNHDFSDRVRVSHVNASNPLFRSRELDVLWGKGHTSVGDVTFESAAYVARYVMKKITGDRADDHYARVSPDGVVQSVLPEFCEMSRRPGIGRVWFERFGKHAYELDSVVVNGREVRPPRYYDTLMEVVNPEQLEYNKSRRRAMARSLKSDNTGGVHGRLAVKERVAIAALAQKKRTL